MGRGAATGKDKRGGKLLLRWGPLSPRHSIDLHGKECLFGGTSVANSVSSADGAGNGGTNRAGAAKGRWVGHPTDRAGESGAGIAVFVCAAAVGGDRSVDAGASDVQPAGGVSIGGRVEPGSAAVEFSGNSAAA